MKKLSYSIKQRKRASTLFALALSEIEAAAILVSNNLYREAVVHLYFSSFYISQALLSGTLKQGNPSHKAVDSYLHKIYGRKKDFPKRYIMLHSRLHKLRTEINYRSAHTPEHFALQKDFILVEAYYKFANKHIDEIDFDDILRDIVITNGKKVKDFSIDIYCPKTYSHHVRFTIWFPPFYLDILKTKRLVRLFRKTMKIIKVKNRENYVGGLNSKLDQYSDRHLLMLDIDSLDSNVDFVLKKYGGIILKSGRGFHFLGKKVIEGKKLWEKTLRQLLRDKRLKGRLDKKHIEISLNRGYSTLRFTTSPIKQTRPQFFKEF